MNIFIDGTRCTFKSGTNISKLRKRYGGAYFPGPGTKAQIYDRVLGGAFGWGTDLIVEQAYEFYLNARVPGVKVNIFGFSRGAAAARKLAQEICEDGDNVDFLGCFDTVSALGVPLWFWPFTKYDDYFVNTRVHPRVIRAAHAMALDDPRPHFTPTPMDKRDGVKQLLFLGDHWDIGAGEETFNWMVNSFES